MYSPLANRLDLLVQRYREAILTKRIKPGQELVVQEEAKALNVPTHFVLTAFRQLANMGLLDLKPGGRAEVKPNNIQSLQALEFVLTRRRG